MKSDGESFARFFAFALVFILGLFFGFYGGWEAGATAIASGQYKAELIVKHDRTTEWKFTKGRQQ